MIRRLAGVLWALAQTLPDPERDPDLGPFCTYLRQKYGRHALDLSPEVWEEGLLELIAETIAEGWDRYGAPSAAGIRGGGVHRQRRGGPGNRPRAGPDEAGGLPGGPEGVGAAASRGVSARSAPGVSGKRSP